MLQGMADTQHSAGSTTVMAEDEYDATLLMSISPESKAEANPGHASTKSKAEADPERALTPGSVPVEGGGTVSVQYRIQDFNATYLDECTREPFPHMLVMQAIQE